MSINPLDPTDPTERPLLLRKGDVITRNPETGADGVWTFEKAHDLGLTVRLECDADGRHEHFGVDRTASIHIRPRTDFWSAA